MPNCKSAAKRARQSEEDRIRNRSVRSRLKTLENAFQAKLDAKDLDGAKAAMIDLISAYSKSAKGSVTHSNKVDRKKSRLAAALKRAGEA